MTSLCADRDNGAHSSERLTAWARKQTDFFRTLTSVFLSLACSDLLIYNSYVCLHSSSLYILHVPTPLAAAWPAHLHFCRCCKRHSVWLGLVVVSFNASPRAPQALFVKKKAIRGSAQDWSCQQFPSCFATAFFFLFLWQRWEDCSKQHVWATLTLLTPSFLYWETQQSAVLSALEGEPFATFFLNWQLRWLFCSGMINIKVWQLNKDALALR